MHFVFLSRLIFVSSFTRSLKGTDWGDLDILILDMPPGTGDVQLTICQDLELSGAVSVTTPSKLAATDAAKGIEMFTSLGVPTLAIVENMSYFDVSARTRLHSCANDLLQCGQISIYISKL
jgi:Mrp family chromosome partitioning ATPase